jgi:hypothetical protein
MRVDLSGSKVVVLAFLGLTGCRASIDGPGGEGTSMGGGASGGSGAVLPPPATPEAGVDPGRVGIHRLNNGEYDNTVRDLLGTSARPAQAFTVAEEGLHFDNTASALGMTPSQYDGFFDAATSLMTEALQSATGRARVLPCAPSGAGDPCARQTLERFGAKIYRRPLAADELERAMSVYDADIARAQSGSEALGQALRAMLASASFLYRVELDPDPRSATVHGLSGYELASRLSYLHWSSMPDDALFESAKNGELSDASKLEATVDRLLSDPKSAAFVESFAGQWLDVRKLLVHSTVPQIFPTFTPALADAMMAESYAWFGEFLTKDRPLSEFFTADFNYVNDVLAQHYGFAAPGSGTELVRVEVTTDQRTGFLGLAGFLTHTSVPSRTSPTARGAWVLGELLCAPPPPPPPDVPKLDEAAEPDAMESAGAENVRERLERHREQGSTCAACHSQFDPMGLGLERYDGIGRYREQYPNGDPIVAEGVMPDGSSFAGPLELGALIGADPRFSACAASMLLGYALGRDLDGEADHALAQRLNERWAARGPTLRNLLKEVVLSDGFRFRRGEPE